MDTRGIGMERVSGLVHELNDAQFSTKMRGYDPSEVDALLDRARETIETLASAERRADERATLAERQLEEELEAARAARATAEASVVTANAEATDIVAAARVEATALSDAAEVEIRRAAEDARNRMLVEISELEHRRDGVLEQIEVTTAHLAAHRTRLQRAVADLSTLVDGIEDRPQGVGSGEASNAATSEAGIQAAAVLHPTARSDTQSRNDAVIERASPEPMLPEPDWAGEVRATEVVRPLRPGNTGTRVSGGAVGGDEGDLEAFFADDGS
ncbi:MAG: DivIVA domain-containing protein [Actinomycetota bacterium]|nr:DivIVA domain-containing protein [Actinomycetota bacterium]MEE3354042.1 DivIVA domain-containing protein [Actinomycetota bacterium]